MSASESRPGGFVTGLVIGALTGAAAALLCSPRTGAENREKLRAALPKSSTDAIERAADQVKSHVEQAGEAYAEATAETRERLERELDETRKGKA